MSLPSLHRLVGVRVDAQDGEGRGLWGHALGVTHGDGDGRTSGWQVTQVLGSRGLLQVTHRYQVKQGTLMTKL